MFLELGIVVAILVGVGQLLKQLGIPNKFIPLINVFFGVIIGITSIDLPTLQEKVLFGVVVGLSASGLFDQSKIITKK